MEQANPQQKKKPEYKIKKDNSTIVQYVSLVVVTILGVVGFAWYMMYYKGS